VENEIAESFLLACPSSELNHDKLNASVKDAVWLPLPAIQDMCKAEPESFSPWFRAEVAHCRWFEDCDFPTSSAGFKLGEEGGEGEAQGKAQGEAQGEAGGSGLE
jgi:hypothetical protein